MIAAEDLTAFAAQRRTVQNRSRNAVEGSVRWALRRRMRGDTSWARTLVNAAERLMRRTYRTEAGKLTTEQFRDEVARYRDEVRAALEQTETVTEENYENKVMVISRWLSNSAINAGTHSAGQEGDRDPEQPSMAKTWITMHDEKVRPAHADVDGVTVPVRDKFMVGGVPMDHPGDPVAPPDLTVNCRCVIAIRPASLAASAHEGETMTTSIVVRDEDGTETWRGVTGDVDLSDLTDLGDEGDMFVTDEDAAIPWHGVLAPENVMSGDGRKFGTDALRWRDLPLPLSWQKVNAAGHDGSVVVGRIDEVWREGNLVKASGVFLANLAEADEAIGLISDGGIRGVSVDVDDATMELQTEDGQTFDPSTGENPDQRVVTVFPDGRICGATLCAIPAFAEAFVGLGDWGGDDALVAACDCTGETEMAISEAPWDGSASNYTDEQYYAATIVHLVDSGPEKLNKSNNKLPILTPSGALSRAGVHAAAGRINQTDAPPAKISAAKARLRGAYATLKEEVPENLQAASMNDEIFDAIEADIEAWSQELRTKTEDGPGWLTHPVDTERLRRYWTRGAGAAKIRWGFPGDFNRCRRLLAKYVKPQFLNGYCANRHYDATGFWPGKAPLERRKHGAETEDMAPSVALVAAAIDQVASRYFENPNLTGPTAMTIDDDGRIFGHLAVWGTCHVGFKGICVDPPHSSSGYAHFLTGATRTERGDIPTGHITLGDGHAADGLSHAAARAHYDNTCSVVADVNCGEDDYGIWVAGLIRDLDAKTLRELRAAPLSGDWRGPEGRRELVAALGVNVPGFLVPRIGVRDGRQVSLVAAGVVDRNAPHVVSGLDLSAAIMAAVDEIETRSARRKMAALKAEIGLDPKSRMLALRAERESV